ncbi:MAG: alpha-glucan family phosphorylase [Gemmataceae bacterium]|nr:alpha-glucan family phosphorylase [Gemmataceae bacterium]MDW8266222.1 alpha-glucan family phosphorylase [Gemmataceae bacterium]
MIEPTGASERPISVAYFSMEVALDPAMPTYSGGLGVLAGDMLRAAADLGVPMAGITLLHRKGYFRQELDAEGQQRESPALWSPEQFLTLLPARVSVRIEDRPVAVQAWQYTIRGLNGHAVPVYFLDTAIDSNSPWDQTLTDHLYGGDARYRLAQEVVLGIGGMLMLRALGHDAVRTYHMNEGHSALLVLGLLRDLAWSGGLKDVVRAATDRIRQQCVFTTHTPVPAGHDQFPEELVRQVLGPALGEAIAASECCLQRTLNMTYLALYFSRYVNGVAMRHGEISRSMFPGYPINSITNGVHAPTWTTEPFQQLFDRRIPEWRRDNLYLRYAVSIPLAEIQHAHQEAKRRLLEEVERLSQVRLDPHTLTIGFARRATPYKRADLLFTDPERLRRMARRGLPLQIIYGGKAHPKDEGGKALIRRIFAAAANLRGDVPVVYLPEYDLRLAKLMCAGVDVWLNTPQKPQEASGTSGMKAALNGVPSLSILDGWWIEGHQEGVTGWSIDDAPEATSDATVEAQSLYNKLEFVIAPMFYRQPLAFAQICRSAIALNGSFFNANRMLQQYVQNAYNSRNNRPLTPA